MPSITNGVYRHYKGKYYVVTGSAKHTETDEEMVVYHAAEDPTQVYVRPATMWNEQVITNKKTPPKSVQRFVPVSGLDLLAKERAKQIEKGYDAAHDDEHTQNQLVRAAVACLTRTAVLYGAADPTEYFTATKWPWLETEDNYRKWPYIKCLVVAGAFIVAELERRMRKGESP